MEALIRAILLRMAEIDSDLTASAYEPVFVEHCHGNERLERQDEAPTGDDYNLLWDAVLDEIKAAMPDLDLGAALRQVA